MIFYCFILGLLIEVQGTPLGAPEYLSIEGHEDCLGTLDKDSFEVSCLPSTRPPACIPPAWDLLQGKFDGERCQDGPVIGGIGGLPPAYLSIDGHEDCLGEYSPSPVSTAVCLPSSRPDQCIPPAWTELQQKFNGENCPEEPVIGGIGGLPPAYLSIDGHEDCLGEYSPSPVSTAVCLPSTRPSDCQRRAWFQLKGKLVNCPEEPVIGGIGGLPPAYLNVRGHEDCLETVTNGGSSQYCFPVSKPGGCLNSAWEELLDVFEGDDCPEGIIVG